ncbi:MAG: twin-arginine translocase TatA/TatE family subunit [Pseudomonadota bacterium]|nr:twin-arginine translocase TatA/TatE family subunit [Pseudomonadota bacterium]
MGIGITELLVILAIVALLFGTKKLRSIGGDLGTAIQSFRKAMTEADAPRGPSEDSDPALGAPRKDGEPKP